MFLKLIQHFKAQMISLKPPPVRLSTIETSSCHNYLSKGDNLKEVFKSCEQFYSIRSNVFYSIVFVKRFRIYVGIL